jgi:hypothetical protein
MTIEELVKIIVEIVAKYMFLERQRVLAVCFDDANSAALLEAAQTINGRADFFSGGAIERITGDYDVMFVDYIRFPDAAEAALGLAFSPWGALAGKMLSRGKPVFQLIKTPGSGELSPACRTMMKGCWKQLYALGARLLDTGGTGGGETKGEAENEAAYTKNVLARQDLFAYAGAARLLIGRDVVVTSLAADTARDMGIQIVRQE